MLIFFDKSLHVLCAYFFLKKAFMCYVLNFFEKKPSCAYWPCAYKSYWFIFNFYFNVVPHRLEYCKLKIQFIMWTDKNTDIMWTKNYNVDVNSENAAAYNISFFNCLLYLNWHVQCHLFPIFHHSILLFPIMVDKMELRNNFFSTSLPISPPPPCQRCGKVLLFHIAGKGGYFQEWFYFSKKKYFFS